MSQKVILESIYADGFTQMAVMHFRFLSFKIKSKVNVPSTSQLVAGLFGPSCKILIKH